MSGETISRITDRVIEEMQSWQNRRGGAKLWMSVLTDIRSCGVRDVLFLVCDGLKGLPRWSAMCGR